MAPFLNFDGAPKESPDGVLDYLTSIFIIHCILELIFYIVKR